MDEKEVKKTSTKKAATTKKTSSKTAETGKANSKTTTTKKKTSSSTKPVKKVKEETAKLNEKKTKEVKEIKIEPKEEVTEEIVKEEKIVEEEPKKEEKKEIKKEEKTEKVKMNPKKKKNILIWSIVGACVLGLAITLYFLVYYQKPYSLKSVIEIELDGYNGYGTVKVTAKKSSKEVERVLSTAHFSISKKEEISNGDEIIIKIDYNKETAKDNRVKIGSQYKFKVEGLPDGEETDLFKGVEFKYENKSPYLNVTINNEKLDTYKYNISYKIEGDTDFYKIGDKIKVKVTYNEDKLHKDGMIAQSDVKEYTIPDTESYIREASDLTDDMKKQIKDDMTKDIKEYINESKVKAIYCDTYDCSKIEDDKFFTLNDTYEPYFMYIRYKDSAQKAESYDRYHTDIVGSFKLSLKDNTNKNEVIYCTVHYDNIYLTEDKTLSKYEKNNSVVCSTDDSNKDLKKNFKSGYNDYTSLVEVKIK